MMLAELWGIEWLYWWQIPLVLVSLPLFVFGGGTLLWVGGRFWARAPKATYWRSIGTNIVAALAAGLAYGLVSAAAAVVGGAVGGGGGAAAGAVLGMFLGAIAALLVTWLVIKAMFATSFGRAILAWLPTLAPGILATPILAVVLVPSFQRVTELTNRTVCMSNLANIGKAMTLYRLSHDNRYPPDFDALIAEGHPAKLFRCPSADPLQRPAGQKYDYFYLPPSSDNYPDQIIVCDFWGNHRGKHRSVLYVGMNVGKMTEAEFQAALERPVNAEFAKALREVDAP
jgi:competence protein ComGC